MSSSCRRAHVRPYLSETPRGSYDRNAALCSSRVPGRPIIRGYGTKRYIYKKGESYYYYYYYLYLYKSRALASVNSLPWQRAPPSPPPSVPPAPQLAPYCPLALDRRTRDVLAAPLQVLY